MATGSIFGEHILPLKLHLQTLIIKYDIVRHINYKIFSFILGIVLGVYSPIHAQYFFDSTNAIQRNKSINDIKNKLVQLDSFEVLAKRFSSSNILDSILSHYINNYTQLVTLKADLEVSLQIPNDTIFKRHAVVYCLQPFEKIKQYILMVRKRDTSSASINRMTKSQSQKIANIGTYPESFIIELLKSIQHDVMKNDVFYECKNVGGRVVFSLILRYNSEKSYAISPKYIDHQVSATASFLALTVDRADWAITDINYIEKEVANSRHDLIHRLNTYAELSAQLASIIEEPTGNECKKAFHFEQMPSGIYKLESFLFTNNLFLAGRKLFTILENGEGWTYRYYLHEVKLIDTPVKNRQELKILNMKDFAKIE